MRSLIIFGLGDLAEIALEYFTHDSEYDVVAFTADREYLPKEPYFHGLPVVPFDIVQDFYSAKTHYFHAAVIYNHMNRDRSQTIQRAKAKNYSSASYISSKAFVSRSAKVGEHAFIFEDNTVQPYVTIGDNAILWSGNHIGHHSRVGNNVFISSHVVVSGHCDIGDNCFLGVNATLANTTRVGDHSWVNHGAVLSGNIPPSSMVLSPNKSEVMPLNEDALNRALAKVARRSQGN